MATGLWLVVTTVDHPSSKPVGTRSRWNVGDVMYPVTEVPDNPRLDPFDSANVPKVGASGEYRAIFYEGLTLADYLAEIPDAVLNATKTVRDDDGSTHTVSDDSARVGYMRLQNSRKPRLRTKSKDWSPDKRIGDKRTLVDRLLRRRV